MEQFKYLVTVVSYLHDAGVFASKSEARRMLKQGGLTFHLRGGPWKPSEHAALIFSSDCVITSKLDDYRVFLVLLK